jgi:hypothetical protein
VCTDLQEFTTVVGPRRSVLKFVERSGHPEPPGLAARSTMPTVWQRHELVSPATLIDLAPLSDDFTEADSPAVAVVHHSGHSSFAVAAELQAELLVGDPINPFAVARPSLRAGLPIRWQCRGIRTFGTNSGDAPHSIRHADRAQH